MSSCAASGKGSNLPGDTFLISKMGPIAPPPQRPQKLGEDRGSNCGLQKLTEDSTTTRLRRTRNVCSGRGDWPDSCLHRQSGF